jgi:CPA2 family monovalent cation:H+ antiporter-2
MSPHHATVSLVELGSAVIGLALLARLGSRLGFSAIPLYLIAGLAFGNGGLAPLDISHSFIETGAGIGVLLLLFMLGLEYSGQQLLASLRGSYKAGGLGILLNFSPGVIGGLLLGWSPLAAVLLGGITYNSSSGIVARILSDAAGERRPEVPFVLSIVVFEDLAMAVYLPLVAVLIAGGGALRLAASVSIALVTVTLVLLFAVRFGDQFSRVVLHESDEVVLLTMLGTILLVAGIAERLQVSSAIGAFLVGIAVSGPLAERANHILGPLRDLFAAFFFFFFGMQINPASLPPVLAVAGLLALVTAATKWFSTAWAARRTGLDRRASIRAGAVLVARGEFSIVIAALGATLEPRLGPIAAAYVLVLAIAGPVCARIAR